MVPKTEKGEGSALEPSTSDAMVKMFREEPKNIKKRESDDVNVYIADIGSKIAMINALGGDLVSPQEEVQVILNGLPPEYDEILSEIAERQNPPDVSKVISMMLNLEITICANAPRPSGPPPAEEPPSTSPHYDNVNDGAGRGRDRAGRGGGQGSN